MSGQIIFFLCFLSRSILNWGCSHASSLSLISSERSVVESLSSIGRVWGKPKDAISLDWDLDRSCIAVWSLS